jgi:hypothetical protein
MEVLVGEDEVPEVAPKTSFRLVLAHFISDMILGDSGQTPKAESSGSNLPKLDAAVTSLPEQQESEVVSP